VPTLAPSGTARVLYPPGALGAAEEVAQVVAAGDESLEPDAGLGRIEVLMPGS